MNDAGAAIDAVWRRDWGRLLAGLAARTRRLDLAEDALGEAFARATERWPVDGVPANPPGWLTTVAHRHVLGRLRAEAVAGRKAPLLVVPDRAPAPDDDAGSAPDAAIADERLRLVFMCCHPALDGASQSALALRLVIGTSTADIARLFLVKEATMAARLTRAKQRIIRTGIPFAVPTDLELRPRLDAVVRTIYLAFTAGYAPGTGADLLRADLAGDAIRLARLFDELVPGDPSVRGLLALCLFQHSRRDARVADGRLVTLREQDRDRWRRDEIAEATSLLRSLPRGDGYGEELRLQAAIAAEHSLASEAASTDWHAIAASYAALERITPSPVVRLNRAVAVAEASGPAAGLALLDGLDDALPASHRLAAVRAELHERLGDRVGAASWWRTSIDRCANDVERDHLRRRLAALDG